VLAYSTVPPVSFSWLINKKPIAVITGDGLRLSL
jgi:hypothetical protein